MHTTTDRPITDRRIATADGKEIVWFLETAAETGGERTFVEAELQPGTGNPLHFHTAYSERFEVLEGTLVVELGRETHHLGPGDSALVPIGARHRFANESDAPVRFRCALEPASRGFEEAQQIMAGLMTDGKIRGDLPKDPRHLGVLLTLADTRFNGTMRLLALPLRLAGTIGRMQGTEQTLRQRYVRW